MTSGEPWAIVRTPGGNRDVPSSRLLAVFLRGSEPPKSRTFVSSARTRMILRTAQKATGNSITRDQIMTGGGRGLDAAELSGKQGDGLFWRGLIVVNFLELAG